MLKLSEHFTNLFAQSSVQHNSVSSVQVVQRDSVGKCPADIEYFFISKVREESERNFSNGGLA